MSAKCSYTVVSIHTTYVRIRALDSIMQTSAVLLAASLKDRHFIPTLHTLEIQVKIQMPPSSAEAAQKP